MLRPPAAPDDHVSPFPVPTQFWHVLEELLVSFQLFVLVLVQIARVRIVHRRRSLRLFRPRRRRGTGLGRERTCGAVPVRGHGLLGRRRRRHRCRRRGRGRGGRGGRGGRRRGGDGHLRGPLLLWVDGTVFRRRRADLHRDGHRGFGRLARKVPSRLFVVHVHVVADGRYPAAVVVVVAVVLRAPVQVVLLLLLFLLLLLLMLLFMLLLLLMMLLLLLLLLMLLLLLLLERRW